MEVKIKNFKLNVFRSLIEQSLIVDSQLIFEVSTDFVRSCSFSSTKSFMKLWTIPFESLISKPEKSEEAELFPEKEEKLEFPTFNMYILKGDLFKKFLSVHTSDTVDLTFNIQEGPKCQASQIIISGKSESNNDLITNFILATEDLITNKIDDYSTIIKECTPDKNMFEFVMSDMQIQEVKRLIKKLHKSIADNTSYLTFTIDCENKKIVVNDKVFNVAFEINPELQQEIKFPSETFKFNILKSDFIITGNQTFSIYTDKENQKVIFGARYAGSLIWCLTTKISDSSDLNLDASVVDATIDSIDDLDIEEYL